jgi:hypothetical protein
MLGEFVGWEVGPAVKSTCGVGYIVGWADGKPVGCPEGWAVG